AITQLLLHIVTGTGNYGEAVFSLHMFTWNFILSIIFILYAAICGLITPYENMKNKLCILANLAIIIILILTVDITFNVF
ncbi:disulfide bond formation protein DsbB, partial [Francisella tularensis subsp. holarctica]|nr:disulfide bond formation protein DsbB [Francisella tularensis subsp. holarctica]